MADHPVPPDRFGGPLHRAVEELPSDLREVMRLSVLKRWSDSAIAAELDLSPEEVRRLRVEGESRLAEDVDLDELRRRLR